MIEKRIALELCGITSINFHQTFINKDVWVWVKFRWLINEYEFEYLRPAKDYYQEIPSNYNMISVSLQNDLLRATLHIVRISLKIKSNKICKCGHSEKLHYFKGHPLYSDPKAYGCWSMQTIINHISKETMENFDILLKYEGQPEQKFCQCKEFQKQ